METLRKITSIYSILIDIMILVSISQATPPEELLLFNEIMNKFQKPIDQHPVLTDLPKICKNTLWMDNILQIVDIDSLIKENIPEFVGTLPIFQTTEIFV